MIASRWECVGSFYNELSEGHKGNSFADEITLLLFMFMSSENQLPLGSITDKHHRTENKGGVINQRTKFMGVSYYLE